MDLKGERAGRCDGEWRDLVHDAEKWKPVFRQDHAPAGKPDHDPIPFGWIMAQEIMAQEIMAQEIMAQEIMA